MQLLLGSGVLLAALASLSCATSEEVDFACGRKSCPDGATGDTATQGTDGPSEGDAALDSATLDDSSTPVIDGSSDVIFPLDDTSVGPTCDGGGTSCGDAGCKNLTSDLSNCGMCGTICPMAANATIACSAGKCGFTCNASYGDCDTTASNGCEASLLTDESNCGMCGKKCTISEACKAGSCAAKFVAIETFETTWPKSPWIVGNGSGAGTMSAACAHDGSLGYAPAALNPIHYYRTDVAMGAPGDKLTAWFRTAGAGRFYLGFGASSSGAYSLIAAPNTNQLYFERNIPYGTYTSLATKARTWSTGVWHKLEITFAAGGLVTGRVYAADGTTVLDTLSTTIAGFAPGGVALRAFAAGTCIDTIER